MSATRFDLRQAYVELSRNDGKTSGIRIGRQDIAFGAERLAGAADWLNIWKIPPLPA